MIQAVIYYDADLETIVDYEGVSPASQNVFEASELQSGGALNKAFATQRGHYLLAPSYASSSDSLSFLDLVGDFRSLA